MWNPNKLSRESRIRIDWLVQFILGNDRYLSSKKNIQLRNEVMEEFEISSSSAKRYVAEARKEIRKIIIKNKDKALNRALRDREFLFLKAKELQDYKLALEVVKDRDKLSGLYQDNLIINDKEPIRFIIEDLPE